jgi:aspartokinase/homoserine dehydrogenase 1
MNIIKFGGSSIETPERVFQVIDIIKNKVGKGECFSVVLSAFGGVTSKLLELGDSASRHAQNRVKNDKSGEDNKEYLEIFHKLQSLHLNMATKVVRGEAAQKKLLGELSVSLNELKDIAQGVALTGELGPKTKDQMLSFGERLSCVIVCEALNENGIVCEFLDAREIIKTDRHFGEGRVLFDKTGQLIRERMLSVSRFSDAAVSAENSANSKMFIVTGFIGSTLKNETIILGRGGSDYTASILASALDSELVEIWTNVSGVMTADPFKVPKAYTIHSISYNEIIELSFYGAKVVHPYTAGPLIQKNIPILIKNTFEPHHPGTLIQKEKQRAQGAAAELEAKNVVTGVTSIANVALIKLAGDATNLGNGMGAGDAVGSGNSPIASHLFAFLGMHKINPLLITQGSSDYSLCVAVSKDHVYEIIPLLNDYWQENFSRGAGLPKIQVQEDVSVVAVVGEQMVERRGIAGQIFHSLGRNNINIVAIAQGPSELNITMVIPRKDEIKALRTLHAEFFQGEAKTLHVYIVGTGLIGRDLFAQINGHRKNLLEKDKIDVRVVGVCNSKQMVIDEKGNPIVDYIDAIKQHGEKANIEKFVDSILSNNFFNSIFVDATASESVTAVYEKLAQNKVAIVTPNKKLNSGPYAPYKKFMDLVKENDVSFYYETNVGAGLPIISTLNNLLASGDEILSIEGILSGTLSFLFNSFVGDKKFSDCLLDAKERGYTEPDPRDDLSGMDVARKILILSREVGYGLELSDIEIGPILPEEVNQAPNMEKFWELLKANDDYFLRLREKAQSEGKVLRYIAAFNEGKAKLSLTAVGPEHPFYSLCEADNIISFKTRRYFTRPLVVSGPGAGAAVTAAGVFSDILRIANYFRF